MSAIQEILASVMKGEITQEEAAQMLANPPKKPKGIYFEVSDKGGVKIKGVGRRFPIVMYPNEIELLLGSIDQLKQFIVDNKEKLSMQKGSEIAEQGPAEGQQEAPATPPAQAA